MDAFCGVAVCLAVLGGTPDGVLLDFSAKWCGPCQSMEPTVHQLQQQGFPIRQIDADASPAVLQRYGVTGLPTFVLIVRGQEVERISGRVSESTLRGMLAKIPEKPAPKPVQVRAANVVTIAGIQTDPPPRAPGLMAGLKSLIKLPLPAAKGPQPVSLDEPAGGRAATVIRANSSDEVAPSIATDPLLGCTRIRVKDSHGLDVGSGTIIHSEPGRTLILTCGHLFRHFDKQGQIKVDIFGPTPQTLDGTLIRHNLDQDIGLISVSPLETLPVVPIAEQAVAARDHVFSIGCGGGDDPTKLQHLVTSTKKYRDFVECTGTPIQGRSGGGLFTKSGKLAGVCVFADPAARRGLYAGLDTISRLLEQCGLSWLRPDSAIASNSETSGPLFEGDIAAADDAAVRFDRMPTLSGDALEAPPFANEAGLLASERATPEGSPAAPSSRAVGEFGLEDLIPTVDDSAFSDSRADSAIAGVPENNPIATLDKLTAVSATLEPSTAERGPSTIEELSLPDTKPAPRRPIVGPSVESLRSTLEAARGAEVVCIVRDRENPDAPSRIVVINQASRQFVRELTGELSQQVQPTSKVIPADRRASTEPVEREKPQRYRRRIR